MTIDTIRDTARACSDCVACEATPGKPCDCHPGVHLCRVAGACQRGQITEADFAVVIPDISEEGQFRGDQVVLGTGLGIGGAR